MSETLDSAQRYLIEQKANLIGYNSRASNDSGVTNSNSSQLSPVNTGFSSYKNFAREVAAPTTYIDMITNQKNATSSYIGFSHLPNQLFRKLVKRGFDFNILLVGESGLGKSTLVNSLFLADIYNSSFPGPSFRVEQTVKVEKHDVLLEEGGVKLRLGVIDTPGFGDHVNNEDAWRPIEDYIEQQYSRYLAAESRVNRKPNNKDTRVHCCLYFVPPRVHGLRQIDLEFMKRLHEQVVIVPVIAKSDALTSDERRVMKSKIRAQLDEYGIFVYYFPDQLEDSRALSPAEYTKDMKFSAHIGQQPFSVVGSNCVMDGRLRARKYPWGIVDIENPEHSDLKVLRDCLMKTNMYNLIDTTHSVLYEQYRASRLYSRQETNVEAACYSPAKAAALAAPDPLGFITSEKNEYDKIRDQEYKQVQEDWERMVKQKEQQINENAKRLEQYALDNQIKLEEQWKKLAERRRAHELKKEQFDRRMHEQVDIVQQKASKQNIKTNNHNISTTQELRYADSPAVRFAANQARFENAE